MPEIVTLVGVRVGVQPVDDGVTNIVVESGFRQYIIPLDADAAKSIGKGLLAPRVEQPPTSKLHIPQ